MSIVHELQSGDQRIEGPGIWLIAGEWQYGVKPERTSDDRERIPFFWATEWPPLGEFIGRFPLHWRAEATNEYWLGGVFNPGGVYWVRYDPRSVGASP